MKDCRKYFAEFLGTALLVLIACGVWVFTRDLVATALAFGLVIVAMAYSIGRVSGCHINPAVSLGVFMSGKMKAKDFGLYVVSQVAGAIAGGAILFGILNLMQLGQGTEFFSMAQNGYSGGVLEGLPLANQIITALIVEALLTFVFVFAILGVTLKVTNKDADFGKVAGIVIGLTLVLVHLIGINITGTSVNPARSIGAAVFAGTEAIQQVWVFIVAPLLGAALAAVAARFVFAGQEESAE